LEYNLAHIGFTIAHEMSHALDDLGSKYDEFGRLNNWWTAKDQKEFEKIQNDVIKQYEVFASYNGIKFDVCFAPIIPAIFPISTSKTTAAAANSRTAAADGLKTGLTGATIAFDAGGDDDAAFCFCKSAALAAAASASICLIFASVLSVKAFEIAVRTDCLSALSLFSRARVCAMTIDSMQAVTASAIAEAARIAVMRRFNGRTRTRASDSFGPSGSRGGAGAGAGASTGAGAGSGAGAGAAAPFPLPGFPVAGVLFVAAADPGLPFPAASGFAGATVAAAASA
jgi:hypothetical protein